MDLATFMAKLSIKVKLFLRSVSLCVCACVDISMLFHTSVLAWPCSCYSCHKMHGNLQCVSVKISSIQTQSLLGRHRTLLTFLWPVLGCFGFAECYNWHRGRWGEVEKRSRQAKRVAILPLQDEGAQPLNLSSKPKTSESKSPTSPASPQVPAMKLGPGSMKHSAPSSIGGPPPRISSIGIDTVSDFFIHLYTLLLYKPVIHLHIPLEKFEHCNVSQFLHLHISFISICVSMLIDVTFLGLRGLILLQGILSSIY